MKLRIRGDSLRLRLTRTDVRKIAQGEPVREVTRFLNGVHLHYILAPEDNLETIRAEFRDHQIVVELPRSIARQWALSSEIALRSISQPSILIEKDFTCLKERQNENEDESDMFENPNSASGHCK